MKIWGSADVLSEEEINVVEDRMFEILSDIGFIIENKKIIEYLGSSGAVIKKNNKVLFSKKWVENFFGESKRIDVGYLENLECWAGGYPLYFLPPGEKKPSLHTLETCKTMVKIADYLENIDIINSAMGIPSDVPEKIIDLYQRLLVWKYFKKPKSIIQNYKPFHSGVSLISSIDICPYIIEMAEIMADEKGDKIQEYCYGDVYLNSPLVFDKIQSEIFMFLFERGFHCDVGTVLTLGGTAPITFSAALPLQLAEIIFVNILQRVFYGIDTLHLANILASIDMRTGIFQYGRPELGLSILAIGQIARKYGALFSCGSYFCDAKLPSSEAGMQKTLSAVSAILGGAIGIGVAGLLSTDEISSPEQLIIDSEFSGALKMFTKNIKIEGKSDEMEILKEVGHGGNFLGEKHTAINLKNLWEPIIFSNTGLSKWQKNGYKVDVDYSREIYESILENNKRIYINELTEVNLKKVINNAKNI